MFKILMAEGKTKQAYKIFNDHPPEELITKQEEEPKEKKKHARKSKH